MGARVRFRVRVRVRARVRVRVRVLLRALLLHEHELVQVDLAWGDDGEMTGR